MSSEQEFDDGFQEDAAADDGSAQEAAPGDEHATDADFTDEEWSDGDGGGDTPAEGDGEPGKAANKKKMNMMLLGGAVVVGLGLTYMMMHKKSVTVPLPTTAPMPAAAPTETDMIYSDQGKSEDVKNSKKKNQSGFLNNPNLIKQAQKMSDSHVAAPEEAMPEASAHSPAQDQVKKPPQPTPIKQVEPDEDGDQPLTPMPSNVAGNGAKPGTTSPAPSGTAPVQPGATQPAPANPAPHPAPALASPLAGTDVDKMPPAHANPTTAAPNPFNGTGANASKTSPAMGETGKPPLSQTAMVPAADNARLDSIASKLDGIESELKGLEGSVVHRDELADIHTQLNALESKVNGMATAGTKVSAAPAATHPAHHVSHVAKMHKTVAKSAPAPRVSWTLKSAMPDMALIAKPDGEIVTVKPGDHIAGLGRIRSIAEQNGRWIVKGTSGSIRQ